MENYTGEKKSAIDADLKRAWCYGNEWFINVSGLNLKWYGRSMTTESVCKTWNEFFFSSLILYGPRKVNSGYKGWPGMLLRSFTDLYNDNDNP